MTTDTSEKGLESLIVGAMTAGSTTGGLTPGQVYDPKDIFGGVGWVLGDGKDYEREYAVDLAQLRSFIEATQDDLLEVLELVDDDGPTRRKFLARLQGEITKRGVIDVLRSGIKHGA